MALIISPSSLGSFGSCPYKWKNSVVDIDPTATAHGQLGNCSAECGIVKTKNKLKAWIKYYEKIINPRLEKKNQLDISKLKKGMFNLYNFFNDLSSKENIEIWQEQKFDYPYKDDVWVSGQPDIFVLYNKPEGDIVAEIFDIKVGKNSWYSTDDIWQENAQRIVYSWFLYQHFEEEFNSLGINNPKIKFSFLVMDKKSGDIELHSRIINQQFVDTQIKVRIEDFLKIKNSDTKAEDYPTKKCRACMFCDFKDNCNLLKENNSLNINNIDIDDLF